MNTSTLRKKLQEYIKVADEKKLNAIYSMVEADISELNNWWNDSELIDELDRRSANLKSGVDPGVSWEIVRDKILSGKDIKTKTFLENIEPIPDFPSIEQIRRSVWKKTDANV